MSTPRLSFQLCDNKSSLEKALVSLYSTPTIIMDCEGESLGKRGGTLSIISLRPAETTKIFLIDVVKLRDSLSLVFNLLQSTEVVKIMYDGRMDFSALYHEFGVHLQNVIDLQLADVHSRQSRGETNAARVGRLSSFLNARLIASSPDMYAAVVKLNGLSLCIEEHLGLAGYKKPTVNHAEWLDRPLSKDHVYYAAADIHLMGLLYNDFLVKGYIGVPRLRDESALYVGLWKDRQPGRKDPYKGHPLLPLEILDSTPDSVRRKCSGCKRFLSQTSFQGEKIRCRICMVVMKRNPSFVNASQKKKPKK